MVGTYSLEFVEFIVLCIQINLIADILSQANPAFGNQLNQLYNEATGPTHYRGAGNVPLPEATPGENGLIGLLSSSIRKLVQDSKLHLTIGLNNLHGKSFCKQKV